MRLFFYFIFSSLLNQQKPLCINCENFIQAKPNLNLNLNNKFSGKCLKFMKHNLNTGEFTYEYADICRIINSKCGEIGKLYKEKDNKI